MKSLKHQLGLLVFLSLILSNAALAGDSTSIRLTAPTMNTLKAWYPTQTIAPYTGSNTNSITFTAGSTPSSYFRTLPSCPLDPSNATQKTIAPVCPDINGKWTTPPAGITAQTTASAQDIKKYCPDVCTTTRVVTANAYTAGGQTIQIISNYTPAICPPGYVQVAATNPQPAVQDTANGGTPPSTDWVPNQATLTAYQNQGMTCYIDPVDGFEANYCSLGSNNSRVPNSCTAYYDIGMDPSNISKYINNAVGTSSGVFAATTYCMGNYVPGSNGTTGSPGVRYYKPDCKNQTLGGPLAAGDYNVLYTNYYQRIRCKPNGLYYSTDKEPATLVCARIKPVWEQRSN
ncbi:MAG TPA: hypothetical protein VFU82_06175 [Gammaproteobacteria bacterium]|nr:hypothetical protein [Gammaproteobacteria bacterium]